MDFDVEGVAGVAAQYHEYGAQARGGKAGAAAVGDEEYCRESSRSEEGVMAVKRDEQWEENGFKQMAEHRDVQAGDGDEVGDGGISEGFPLRKGHEGLFSEEECKCECAVGVGEYIGVEG